MYVCYSYSLRDTNCKYEVSLDDPVFFLRKEDANSRISDCRDRASCDQNNEDFEPIFDYQTLVENLALLGAMCKICLSLLKNG